jgi:hypothetical protein
MYSHQAAYNQSPFYMLPILLASYLKLYEACKVEEEKINTAWQWSVV